MREEGVVNFRDRKLVFVDVETTGLDVSRHEIIQVAYLVVDGREFKVVVERVEKVRPEHPEWADPGAVEINGYKEEEWRRARSVVEVLNELAGVAPEGMIVGWNVAFDWAFLEKGFETCGIVPQFDYHRLDVMSMAYVRLYGRAEIGRLGLRRVAPHFGIELGEKHDALADVKATYEVFRRLMEGK